MEDYSDLKRTPSWYRRKKYRQQYREILFILIVRNYIYSAFTISFTGVLFLESNLYLPVLPIIFWIYLTVLLKLTE